MVDIAVKRSPVVLIYQPPLYGDMEVAAPAAIPAVGFGTLRQVVAWAIIHSRTLVASFDPYFNLTLSILVIDVSHRAVTDGLFQSPCAVAAHADVTAFTPGKLFRSN